MSFIRISAAAAALAAVAVLWAGPQAPQPQKKVKDQGEFDLYTETFKSIDNPAKQIEGLGRWTSKYPDSDYADERLYLYLQAYSKLTPAQPAKVIDYGRQLMTRGLATAFPGPGGLLNILNVLYLVAWNAAGLGTATGDQLALGEKAARELLEVIPRYFTPENRPANHTETQWAEARADLEKRARTALIAIAIAPGKQALEGNPADCKAAEAAFSRALDVYPGEASISYNLGAALNCRARSEPDHAAEIAPRAVFQFVRAAALDASLGGTADAKKISEYANAAYVQFHGSDDGLAALQELVKRSPLAPAGFTIEPASSVARRKEQEFAEKNPQVGLWLRIRAQLAEANGQQYFDGQLKDLNVAGKAGLRALKGTVAEGRPVCRSRELVVAVQGGRAEITLRLDAALTGKPAGEIEWDGVPKTFTQEPFMLTMDVPRGRITGLKVEPCGGK